MVPPTTESRPEDAPVTMDVLPAKSKGATASAFHVCVIAVRLRSLRAAGAAQGPRLDRACLLVTMCSHGVCLVGSRCPLRHVSNRLSCRELCCNGVGWPGRQDDHDEDSTDECDTCGH